MTLIGNRMIHFDIVGSTNDEAWRLLQSENIEEGTIIYTRFQTAGRGQGGTSWESEAGSNLTFSLVLKPSYLPVSQQFLLNQAISVALCKTVSELCPMQKVTIKWPNDIYTGNKKIGGILIENSIMGAIYEVAVVGIGLNINQERFFSDASNPVSLYQLSGQKTAVSKCLETACHHLEVWTNILKMNDKEKIRHEYLSRLYGYGRELLFQSQERAFKARITGISEYGKIILNEDGINTEYDTKTLEFILSTG